MRSPAKITKVRQVEKVQVAPLVSALEAVDRKARETFPEPVKGQLKFNARAERARARLFRLLRTAIELCSEVATGSTVTPVRK